jgi:CxxC motif-containing protein (DUF1111 family)
MFCNVVLAATKGTVAALLLTALAAINGSATPPSLREHLLSLPVTDQLGGATTRALTAPNAFSFQAANAPARHQRPFSFGNRLFNTNWVEAPASVKKFDGLGPLFNRVSCSGCHTKDGRGAPPATGTGPMDSMLFRISIPGTLATGAPQPVPGYGDQLSERAIADVAPEGIAKVTYTDIPGSYADGETYVLRKPAYRINAPAYGKLPADMMLSPRVAPQVIGLGLLEAVPDSTLRALADPEDKDGDGISGRLNTVWNAATSQRVIGRFGWKASQPDLFNQNAAAAIGDMGLTSDLHAQENCAEGQLACAAAVSGGTPEVEIGFLEKLTLYTQTLAVPAQRAAQDVTEGSKLFRDMGCAACHMPSLQSGEHPVAEIANQTFHPYTDLLLHDMGEALSDNRPDFDASGNEWRTPPLWGLGLVPTVNGHQFLLHDGRARGPEEAILWHGGEAEKSKEAFRTAPKPARDALVRFLNSL